MEEVVKTMLSKIYWFLVGWISRIIEERRREEECFNFIEKTLQWNKQQKNLDGDENFIGKTIQKCKSKDMVV